MSVHWNDDMDSALHVLWLDPANLSYTEIGERLGMNRNQIAGRCNRLGLKRDLDMLSDIVDGHSVRSVAKHWSQPPTRVRKLWLAREDAR